MLECERIKKQKIKINISLQSDEFIDYSKLSRLLQIQMKAQKFYKIEDALSHFQSLLKQEYPSLKALKLKISKPQVFKLIAKAQNPKNAKAKSLKTTPSASLKHIY